MTFPIRQLPPNEYPPLLKEIPDKPSLLYIRGVLPSPETKYLCVVGSRASTPYGRRLTQKLIAGLAKYPVCIVSGMAIGIDSEAHNAALDVGLPTIAVLPSGLDDHIIYPAQHRKLAAQILKKGGALISENEPDFKAMIHSFSQRNRIAAGMSTAALIIEAGEKSGTLITAKLALDYNREVLAIPHELGRDTGTGVNALIRAGATLVRNSEDILEALGLKLLENPVQATLPSDLNEREVAIMESLTEAMTRDDLIEISGLSAQDANIGLSSLQIRGLVVERLGKIERI
jgi:DNA processing protein